MGHDRGFLSFLNIRVNNVFSGFDLYVFILFIVPLVLLEPHWLLLKFIAFYQAFIGSLCTALESPRAELRYWMLKNFMNVQRLSR